MFLWGTTFQVVFRGSEAIHDYSWPNRRFNVGLVLLLDCSGSVTSGASRTSLYSIRGTIQCQGLDCGWIGHTRYEP